MTDTEAVVSRFFAALSALKERKRITGYAGFAKSHGVARSNMHLLKDEPWRGIFRAGWLAELVRDYGVDAHWLLTGEGEMFPQDKSDKTQEP